MGSRLQAAGGTCRRPTPRHLHQQAAAHKQKVSHAVVEREFKWR